MAVTLEQVKTYLRVDLEVEDDLIKQCMRGAESYLTNAIDKFAVYCKYGDFDESADILRLAVIAEMYTHRDGTDEKAQTFPYFIRSMIAQLQHYVPAGGEPP
ncbi:head-tail connector protein [uncultured Selenomonas sp.]|uniref:head-tail connector protein n=1 Tax=uncultured Selenomonas sp. TaxID=159275 RepID=UPI0028ECCAE0|nr:head-tail connector protein [uncultured Selenomonas sp.]